MARTIQGVSHTWQVGDSPIGSGDAGEVYPVVCQDQPNLTGMMKKPSRIATAGTIQRQAGQIANEALALKRLDGLPRGKAHPPRLLDQAPEYTNGTANYFIVSETAPGEDLDAILSETRKTGKPFPRRVIMTVLDALFDMFSRAHEAGVLWNDVKLDHIYWHNLTGQVGVIDWGNALFLDTHDQHALPRWEDYQQMIETLGNFLQRTAPELYDDLGWEEFQGKQLDSPQVSILARRITYQQQVIALQVMEYQALMRVVINADPSLEGLRKIAEYQQVLEKTGAPWDQEDVLKYSQSLVEAALDEGNRQTCVSATSLVWELFDDSLDLPWHLMREYCRYTDILTHPAFASLVKSTLKANWKGAIWSASTIASQLQDPVWWDRLIPVMRQKALGKAAPSPLKTCQTLLSWAQENHQQSLAQKLTHIIQGWYEKGINLVDSPFDYDLLDIVRQEKNIPNSLLSQIKKSFVPGDEAIRKLVKAWTHTDWEALPKAFQHTLSWDPDRWGILYLASQVEVFQTWCQELYQGPGETRPIRAYLENAIETRPKIERALGTPPWMNALKQMLNQIMQGVPVASLQSEVSRYCPWMLAYPDIDSADARLPEFDEAERQAFLMQFSEHLKHRQAVDECLKTLSEQAPDIHSICRRLANGHKHILSLTANLDEIAAIAAGSVPTELNQGAQVLQNLVFWRSHLENGDLSKAHQSLLRPPMDGWPLAIYANQITADWQDTVLPNLNAILSFTIVPDIHDQSADPQVVNLHQIAITTAELPSLWSQIDKSGIHAKLLEAMESRIEEVRSAFMEWRGTFEASTDQVIRLVYHSHLDIVRQVSNRFLRMAQHIRQAKLAFANMIAGEKSTLTFQLKQIENILDHLAALEAIFIAEESEKHFPGFQNDFQKIITAKTTESRQASIASLTENHPFYAWLVKSSLTQETFYY